MIIDPVTSFTYFKDGDLFPSFQDKRTQVLNYQNRFVQDSYENTGKRFIAFLHFFLLNEGTSNLEYQWGELSDLNISYMLEGEVRYAKENGFSTEPSKGDLFDSHFSFDVFGLKVVLSYRMTQCDCHIVRLMKGSQTLFLYESYDSHAMSDCLLIFLKISEFCYRLGSIRGGWVTDFPLKKVVIGDFLNEAISLTFKPHPFDLHNTGKELQLTFGVKHWETEEEEIGEGYKVTGVLKTEETDLILKSYEDILKLLSYYNV